MSLTFKGKRGLVVHALDATGKAVGQIPARNTADGTVLTLGPDAKTCFFAVESE